MTETDLREILKQNREHWRLSGRETLRVFIKFLLEKTDLQSFHIQLPQRAIHGYTWGSVPIMETLLTLVPGSYFSHYTAMRLHGLTEQVPKTLYLSRAKLRRKTSPKRMAICTQADIDTNFAKPAKLSSNQVDLPEEGLRLMLLEGMDHQGAGIIDGLVNLGGKRSQQLRYTSLERTLIDIVVRPPYAGGVFEIAKAFENAQGRLSVNRMNSLYRKMQFFYPYHQAIGYYLERAAYRQSLVELFRNYPMEHDFYLSHGMTQPVYNERWRLFVPEGL